MSPNNQSFILRAVFVVIAMIVGVAAAKGLTASPLIGALIGGVFALLVVILDGAIVNLSFRQFSHGTIGLVIGLICGVMINYALGALYQLLEAMEIDTTIPQVMINMTLGYLGMSLAMRANQQEFSFLIPYVRFRQDSAQDSPLLVDSNIIIDGRIPRICKTGFLSGALVVPRFVLDELHVLADSNDPIKSGRGKRGLETLKDMQQSRSLEVTIQEDHSQSPSNVSGEATDTKLIQLAKRLGARLLTNDANLGKVAQLQDVTVLNLNLLSKAMRPGILPGDPLQIKLVKEGKDDKQAVGYLDDGTMIVVNNAVEHLGELVDVVIGSPLQTSAGRLIFAELKKAQSSS